jgi:leucyl aminopeptidase (aminopeptidase T)
MIKLRHQQPSLWHRGLAEDIEGLWEPWMRLVDELLEDEQLVDTVYEAQGERYPVKGGVKVSQRGGVKVDQSSW